MAAKFSIFSSWGFFFCFIAFWALLYFCCCCFVLVFLVNHPQRRKGRSDSSFEGFLRALQEQPQLQVLGRNLPPQMAADCSLLSLPRSHLIQLEKLMPPGSDSHHGPVSLRGG